MPHAIYIYGVINSNEKKKFSPINKTNACEFYTIPFQDIACVVSDYPEDSLYHRIKEEVVKELVSHQTVIERIMKEHTIVPVKFGTLLENRNEVRKVLEKGYFEFKQRLKEIDKKIELDLAAMWNDLNSVIKKISEEDEEIRKFKEEIAKKPPKDSFQDRIKIGSMINDSLDKRREELQKEMLEFLKSKVKIEGSKKHETMYDRIVLNCAFLLDKNREHEFDKALSRLNEMFEDRVNFRCIGPLPPYSFFTYEIKKANFEVIDVARKLLGLGVEVDASDIKTAYRRLVQEKHPDRHFNNIDAQKQFEEIQKAYKLLLDYCRSGKKPLNKEDVEDTYLMSIFDTGYKREGE
jgi:hypothetical protein